MPPCNARAFSKMANLTVTDWLTDPSIHPYSHKCSLIVLISLSVAHQLSTSHSELWIFSSDYWILCYWKLRIGKEPFSFEELEIEQPSKGYKQPFFFFWSSAHIAKMCQRGPGDVGKIPTWYIPGVYSPLVSTLPVFYATRENQWHGPTLGRSLSSHFILTW